MAIGTISQDELDKLLSGTSYENQLSTLPPTYNSINSEKLHASKKLYNRFKRKFYKQDDDTPVDVEVKISGKQMTLKDVKKFAEGKMVEFDSLFGEPTVIYADGKPVAHGRIVETQGNMSVLITEIVE